MVTIKIKNENLSVPKGTTPLSLLADDVKKDYFICLVNGRVRELTYPLMFDAEVEYLNLSNSEVGKVYEASLRYVIAMAFKNLYPNASIRFNYNVSRSILCTIANSNLTIDVQVVNNVRAEVERLINADLPIKRITVSLDEAKKIYQDFGMEDKLNILTYRPERDVHLYECDKYLNYMHAYMVPSTGYLKKFIIKPYSPGLIIQYPRFELNGQIPVFQDAPVYGRTLKRAYEWSKMIDTKTIFDINQKVNPKNIVDFIQTCETKHNNMIAELGKKIADDIENIRLILIAGPSSSGKTTFSNRLRIELLSRGIKPIMISMDDYYLDRDKIAPGPDGKLDLENINTLDIDLFNQHMYSLINGEEVEIPRFDFNIAKRVKGHKLQVPTNQPIIIEGIHALNEQMSSLIPKHQKFKIFISPQIQINIDNHSPMSTTDLRLIRRIVRDNQFRNAPAKQTLSMWSSVRRGEFRWIYPHQEGSDYVFNSELTYELCVLKKYAVPLLKAIGPEDEYFIMANRLLKYLKYFTQVEENAIPCNSLIREFIGGSCFYDV